MKTISVEIVNIYNPTARDLAIRLDKELESIGVTFITGKGYVYDDSDVNLKSRVRDIIEKYLAYKELNIHVL